MKNKKSQNQTLSEYGAHLQAKTTFGKSRTFKNKKREYKKWSGKSRRG